MLFFFNDPDGLGFVLAFTFTVVVVFDCKHEDVMENVMEIFPPRSRQNAKFPIYTEIYKRLDIIREPLKQV